VIVIQCDADVHKVERFERGEPLDIKRWYGEGGTDFRPVFRHIEREGIEPVCLIYLTDGHGAFPDAAPDYPVLWAVCQDPGYPVDRVPWGEMLQIPYEP
jgi:predicted metal-dependent peptidase